MCGAPEHTPQSHYWQLRALISSVQYIRALTALVVSRLGESSLRGLVLGGVQLAWSSGARGDHFDNPDIAALLVTVTLSGVGNVHIIGADRFESPVNVTFPQ